MNVVAAVSFAPASVIALPLPAGASIKCPPCEVIDPVPKGVPVAMLLLVVPIEVLSYFMRPISHSVRLFAVMLAGHITLKVFAGFVVSLGGLGALGIVGAVLPLAMTVALTGLELLMSVIQAYIFTMLTCMYLNDALHPGH